MPAASEVRITTIDVELAAVRVGNKQMTQAVYNQIPMVGLQSDDGRGNWDVRSDVKILGYGRHKPTDCKEHASERRLGGEHLHLLFTKEGTLYRDCFELPPDPWDDDLVARNCHWLLGFFREWEAAARAEKATGTSCSRAEISSLIMEGALPHDLWADQYADAFTNELSAIDGQLIEQAELFLTKVRHIREASQLYIAV